MGGPFLWPLVMNRPLQPWASGSRLSFQVLSTQRDLYPAVKLVGKVIRGRFDVLCGIVAQSQFFPSLTSGTPLASLSPSLSPLVSVPPSTEPASMAAGRTFTVLLKS